MTTQTIQSRLRSNWWKIIIIAFLFSIFYALLHGALPTSGTAVLPPSVIVESGLLPIAFILYGAVWFGLLACIFVVIQNRLPGQKLIKGLIYGVCLFVIVFITYFEPLPHSGSLAQEMTWMLADGVPLLILGALLGIFLADNKNTTLKLQKPAAKNILVFFVIPVIFLVGRVISLAVIGIYSSYSNLPAQSLAWAFTFGLSLGVIYFLLRSSVKQSTPLKTSLFFAVCMFGLFIFFFNFAFPLIVRMEWLPIGGLTIIDLIVRVAVDILFLTLGILLYEHLINAEN